MERLWQEQPAERSKLVLQHRSIVPSQLRGLRRHGTERGLWRAEGGEATFCNSAGSDIKIIPWGLPCGMPMAAFPAHEMDTPHARLERLCERGGLTMAAKHDAIHWADTVTGAYAADAKPPLTQDLVGQIQAALLEALRSVAGRDPLDIVVDRLNAALDSFEVELGAVAGPRVASLDEVAGSVVMEHRSEAGQPLRAFGGQ